MQSGDTPTPPPAETPPQQDMGPLSQIPGMTYVSPMAPQRKSSVLPVVLGLLALVIIGGIGTVAYLSLKTTGSTTTTTTTTDVTAVFTSAITQGLSTGTVQRHVFFTGLDYTLQQDASNLAKLKMSGVAQRTSASGNATVELYADLSNSYIKYDSGSAALVSPTAVGSWLGVRRGGTTLTGLTQLIDQMTTPEYLLMGGYIFGNFTADQRTALVKFLTDKPVYTFDAAKVTQSVLNGKNVYVYDMTFNDDNLIAYNRMIAADYGMSDKNIANLVTSLQYYGTNKVYVDPALKQIVQVEFLIKDLKITQVFDKFNQATVTDEPAAVKMLNQVVPLPSL